MNKRYLSLASIMTLCLLLLLISGCGSSSNKEGETQVVAVSETACITCHSTSVERLTGYPIVANYTQSVHNLNSVGCQACHGPGGAHNGIGPIPFPSPNYVQCQQCHDGNRLVTNYAASNHLGAATEDGEAKCNRCHTHQGAVLSAISHYTGDGNVIAAMVGAPGLIPNPEPIKCNTCHDTHDAKTLRVDTAWAPSAIVGSATTSANAQFRLCTQCHGYTNPAGLLMGSGTAASGTVKAAYHDTSWYRIIGTTHWDNPATGYGLTANVVEGYVLRHNRANPCYDCHGHEAKAGTRRGNTTTPTIYTDWAQSGHAGGLLVIKYATAAANPQTGSRGSAEYTTTGHAQVDAVMAAGPDAAVSWPHYNWDDTATRGACQKCHTATGIANFLANQAGYNFANNSFTHLQNWSATGGSPQNELLYCWGCHSDAATGALINTTSATTEVIFNGQAVVISGVHKSVACVVCHGGRGSASEAILTDQPRSTRFVGHHAPTAGIMFSAQTHMAYEYPGLNYANPALVHDKIGTGLGGAGPCVSCHMAERSHSFEALEHNSAGVATAIKNQALCNGCHNLGGSAAVVSVATLSKSKAGFAQASTILNNYVNNLAGFGNYLGYAINNANYNNQNPAQPVGDNDYGAFQNAKVNSDEPCAYLHNSLYAKRLVFDSIDWMDNGVLNGTISFDPAAFPDAAAWLGANASGVAPRPPGTSVGLF
ncbi:MAG: cytochrome C [Syntrophales bacterium]